MKRFLLILGLLFATTLHLSAQEDDDSDDNETIRDKMSEYIQKKLNLSNEEASKFKPTFIQYFREWRATIRENRGDKLVLKQKVADLQIRYRDRFKGIIGEQRSNEVFNHQRDFIQRLREEVRDRRQKNDRRRN
ncbi:MAG: hypothetical protein EOO05_03850 [Chitinophagaceae bacterium]|nr:MAG: hypothetical protein EOO05_03850 [Chitinophagaceae bacterium]